MKKTQDNSNQKKILICQNEGFAGSCPCALEMACKKYIKGRERKNKCEEKQS
jgi:hypothetical protein